MARDFDGSSHILRAGTSPLTAVACSMACWFYSDQNTATVALMDLSNNSPSGLRGRFGLQLAGAVGGDPVQAVHVNDTGGATGTASSSTGFSTDTWQHAAAVFGATNSRDAFLNGTNKGSNTTSVTGAMTLNRTRIGGRIGLTGAEGNFHNGRIAEAAIWNVALTDAEVAELALGVSPLMVRPSGLVFYAPLLGRRDPEIELRQARNLDVATPVYVEHPRVFYVPALQMRSRVASSATYERTVSSVKANLIQTNTRTVSNHQANLLATNTRTVGTTKTNLLATSTRTVASAKANLLATSQRTVAAVANLKATATRTVSSAKANLLGTATRAVAAAGNLKATNTRTVATVKANLAVVSTRIVTAVAVNLKATSTRAVGAAANVAATSTRTVSAAANIIRTGTRTVVAAANLARSASRTVPSAANIIVEFNYYDAVARQSSLSFTARHDTIELVGRSDTIELVGRQTNLNFEATQLSHEYEARNG